MTTAETVATVLALAPIGALCVVAVVDLIESLIRPHPRNPEPTTVDLPPMPDVPVLHSDRPITPDELAAAYLLLHRRAHVWLADAMDVMEAQVARDEAAGLDEEWQREGER